MTKHEEAILSSCERYIHDGVANKYVCEYYKKLTDINLYKTDKTDLRDSNRIREKRIEYAVLTILVGILLIILFIATAEVSKFLRYLAIYVGCAFYYLMVFNTVGMWNRGIAKLMWSCYSCADAEEWFVDFLVGGGIVKL